MKNPWLQLPKKTPFILPNDLDEVTHFNAHQHNIKFNIILNEIPSPYIGDPESPIIFLSLNPAYSSIESEGSQIAQYQKISQMNLLHQFTDYPFYVFDPSLTGTPSGYEWFNKRFSPLAKAAGISMKDLSKKIFLAEYFSYRSQKYGWENEILLSQKYTFSLVKKAISRNAIIIIMRSKKLWINAIPALETYKKCYELHSCQQVYINEKNLGTREFDAIVEKIKKEN